VGLFVGDSWALCGTVGLFVGDLVGVFVGDLVGLFVGDFVGRFVGDLVGLLVGDVVGIEGISNTHSFPLKHPFFA
jgi:hypothetical protein